MKKKVAYLCREISLYTIVSRSALAMIMLAFSISTALASDNGTQTGSAVREASANTIQQNKTVKGTVTASSGEVLPGVTVLV